MTNITFYANKHNQWIERETLKEPLISEVYDVVERLNDTFGIRHWAFPEGVNPNDFPELKQMQIIVEKHLDRYHNDFYLWDCLNYFEFNQKMLWCLRSSGTHVINLSKDFEEEKLREYNYYIDCNEYYYYVNKSLIKKVSKDKARSLLYSNVKEFVSI